MRKTIVGFILAAAALVAVTAFAEPAPEPEPVPLGGRCIGIKPICSPGTRPICLCESAISLNCMWVCAD